MDSDPFVRFRRAYWQAFRYLDTIRLRHWEQFGLTLPQLRVLYQIRRAPGITTRDLSRAIGVTVSTTSGLVAKLVDRGLVDRASTPEDRRLTPLRLTAAGETLTGDLAGANQEMLLGLAEELGDDMPAVTAALERLAAAAQARAADAVSEARP